MQTTTGVRRRWRTARGANMVEYIILVGIVALLAIIGFQAFSNSVKKKVIEQGGEVQAI